MVAVCFPHHMVYFKGKGIVAIWFLPLCFSPALLAKSRINPLLMQNYSKEAPIYCLEDQSRLLRLGGVFYGESQKR